jgi:hypothetical protein
VAAYVFSLRYEDSGNWEICQRERLIGVRGSRHAQARAQQITPGETVYVWRGGVPKRGTGLIARFTTAGPGLRAENPPWPDPERYTWVIPIRDIECLTTAVPDRFPGNREGVRFKVQNSAVQQGLQVISRESAALMERCFTDEGFSRAEGEGHDEPVLVATGRGWSADQTLIRKVEVAAVAAVRILLEDRGWTEVRDRQRDGCGYDLLYRGPSGEEVLVEVKGTIGSARRFILTRREHEVLSRDRRARVFLVLDALNTATVEVLGWPDVQKLGLTPDRWRVGA